MTHAANDAHPIETTRPKPEPPFEAEGDTEEVNGVDHDEGDEHHAEEQQRKSRASAASRHRDRTDREQTERTGYRQRRDRRGPRNPPEVTGHDKGSGAPGDRNFPGLDQMLSATGRLDLWRRGGPHPVDPVVVEPNDRRTGQLSPFRWPVGAQAGWNRCRPSTVCVQVHGVRLPVLERAVRADTEIGVIVVVGDHDVRAAPLWDLKAVSGFDDRHREAPATGVTARTRET